VSAPTTTPKTVRARAAAPRTAGTRTRRSSESVRGLILEAARELFLGQGYDATTTKQICEEAGVAEPLLFSNFGSKAALFDLAVLAPIAEFVADYAKSWQDSDDASREHVDAFVSGLFTLAQRNRTVLLDAVGRRLKEGSQGDRDVLDQLAATLSGLGGVSNLGQYADVDAPAAVAAALAMVLGLALLDDLIFPRGMRRPSRERLVAEIEKLILYGVSRRDA
jgi:AcrR family transcriptional regulator